MKRRNFLKTCFLAPFVVLFKKKKPVVLFKKKKPDVRIFPTEEEARSFSRKNIEFSDSVKTTYKVIKIGEIFPGKVKWMEVYGDDIWIATENEVYKIKNYET